MTTTPQHHNPERPIQSLKVIGKTCVYLLSAVLTEPWRYAAGFQQTLGFWKDTEGLLPHSCLFSHANYFQLELYSQHRL